MLSCALFICPTKLSGLRSRLSFLLLGTFVSYAAASLSPRTDVLMEDGGLSGGRTANRLRADVVCVLAKVHMLLLNISSPVRLRGSDSEDKNRKYDVTASDLTLALSSFFLLHGLLFYGFVPHFPSFLIVPVLLHSSLPFSSPSSCRCV